MVCPGLQLIGNRKMVIDYLEEYTRDEWESTKAETGASEKHMKAKFKSEMKYIEKRMSKPRKDVNTTPRCLLTISSIKKQRKKDIQLL